MRQRIKQIIYLSLVLMLGPLSIIAQDSNAKQTLATIIETLEKGHDVQFNFEAERIQSVILFPPKLDFSLEDALEYLQKRSPFNFEISPPNFVLVKPKTGYFICAYLKSAGDKSPISSASIQGGKHATITDETGFFQLELESPSEIINIRHLGHKSISQTYDTFNKSECADIFMNVEFQPLSEVLITNYITAGISKLNNGSFEINFSEFDILPGLIDHDVLQALQAFPGIQSSNETVSNINIRGGTHDQNLLLWDGIKMYQSGHFFGLISMYNPQITQQVSLIKNGSEVSYTDGVSGTINMQTQTEINKKFKGNIGFNLTDVNGFVDLPISETSSLQIAARKGLSDFIETPTYKTFFDRISQDTEVETNITNTRNSDKTFDFYDTSLRWIYELSPKDEWRINFITVGNQLQFNETAMINGENQAKESSLSQNSIASGLSYHRDWNRHFKSTFEVYETDYKLKAINENVLDAQRFLQENKVSETSLKLKTNYIFNPSVSVQSGYHFVETEVTNLDDVDVPLFRELVSEVLRTHGVFTQLDWKSKNQNRNLVLGLRYNYLDKFSKSIWEPRLSFSQRFLKDFALEILGEIKHQNTSQVINFQNDFLGIEKRRWQLSNNADIPVITSKQLSIGFSYNHSGWLANIEAYYKNIEGITAQSQGFQNQYEFEKATGSYEVGGMDVLLQKKLKAFNSWISYSYMKNNYKFTALEAEAFPSNFDITHALTFGASYKKKHIKLALGWNWHSGIPSTKPLSLSPSTDGSINFGPTNATRLKDYMRWDVSGLYNIEFTSKLNGKIGISIWNLLDTENEINNFYRIDGGSVVETIQPALGLTPNFVFRLHF